MKDFIDKEVILDLCKKEIKEQISAIMNDTYYDFEKGKEEKVIVSTIGEEITKEIRNNLDDLVQKEIKEFSKETTKKMITKIIDDEITISDGWENKKINFSELVKKEIKKNLHVSTIDRHVREVISEKINKLSKDKVEEVIKDATKSIFKEI